MSDKLAERRARIARLKAPPRARAFGRPDRNALRRPANDNAAPLGVRLVGVAIGVAIALLVILGFWLVG